MTTEHYKNVKEWGIFIFLCLIIAYLSLYALFFHSWITKPLSNWIFFGPLLIFSYAGFFISMRLTYGKELPDESDKAEIRERYTGLKASVIGFVTWLIVLVLFDQIQVEINVFLSLFCGCAFILGIYWVLKMVDRKSR